MLVTARVISSTRTRCDVAWGGRSSASASMHLKFPAFRAISDANETHMKFAGRVSSSGRALRQLRATQCLISMNRECTSIDLRRNPSGLQLGTQMWTQRFFAMVCDLIAGESAYDLRLSFCPACDDGPGAHFRAASFAGLRLVLLPFPDLVSLPIRLAMEPDIQVAHGYCQLPFRSRRISSANDVF